MPPPKKPPTVSPLVQIREIEQDPTVAALIAQKLPSNYDFEIGKTIWRIRKNPNCKTVALQFPEGLLIFSTRIGDILHTTTGVDIMILGDITYGACCIDDTTAALLGADLLVHYGHSCLVPTSVANKLETIYVFVTIQISVDTAASSISNLLAQDPTPKGKIKQDSDKLNVSLVSTIQFANSLIPLKQQIEQTNPNVVVNIPRSKPLSSGEILGCTAPTVKDDVIVYVGDGRFHLEAMMMANPKLPAFRYDPYNNTMTKEDFDHDVLKSTRTTTINTVTSSRSSNLTIGVIQGTLGRQGNPTPVHLVYDKLRGKPSFAPFIILMSEVMPAKLSLFKHVDAWVQFACPRLSIDWGAAFNKPVLTPYEALSCLVNSEPFPESHPMDYYAYQSTGPHTPNHKTTI